MKMVGSLDQKVLDCLGIDLVGLSSWFDASSVRADPRRLDDVDRHPKLEGNLADEVLHPTRWLNCQSSSWMLDEELPQFSWFVRNGECAVSIKNDDAVFSNVGSK